MRAPRLVAVVPKHRGWPGGGDWPMRLALLAPAPALACALALAGCAAPRYTLPMTADEQRTYQAGAALVAYLGQPGAGGGVCDPGAGPSALVRDGETAGALVEALLLGSVPAEPWSRCVAAWLAGAAPPSGAPLLERLLMAALGEIERPDFGGDAARAARTDTLIRAYADRPPGQETSPGVAEQVAAALTADLALGVARRQGPQHEAPRQALGPGARARALALAQAIDPVTALGRPVDGALLDELAAMGDEATLRQLAARLRDDGLRTEARRRVIRLHLAASGWPEVRASAAAVEEAVLRTGVNAVALAEHPVRRAWLEPGPLPAALLEQHPLEQVARLLTAPPAGVVPALFPEQPLRTRLRLELAGYSAPVTLCAPPAELEVTPCLRPAEVSVAGTSATLDAAGVLRLRERLSQPEVVALARGGRGLVVPLLVAGRPATFAAWPLAYAAPPELVFAGAEGGGPGPALVVRVEALAGGPLVVEVGEGAGSAQVVVARAAAAAFRVVSRGGRGSPGQDGWPGTSGSDGRDGSDASCPSLPGSDGGRGGDGSDGGDGGSGGPGGPGGDVEVTLLGGSDGLSALREQLRRMVVSEGGAGGPGGRGGEGGAGGRGGRGGGPATCAGADGATTSLAGGTGGASGSSGRSGRAGPDGRPGPAGSVIFRSDP